MHTEAFNWVKEIVDQIPLRTSVVEFGGRNINGSVRGLFPQAVYRSIDLMGGVGVDFVGDAEDFWLHEDEDGWPIDTVIACEVFEHSKKWKKLIAHAYKLLCDGGYLIITCATDPRLPHNAAYGGPITDDKEYYGNVDPSELASFVKDTGFSEHTVLVFQDRGDLYCLAKK